MDPKTDIEVFDPAIQGILKMLAGLLSVWILPALSTRCFHQWRGAKMMLREVHTWIRPDDFVYKTDVHNYYASMNHGVILYQLFSISFPQRWMETVLGYCERTLMRRGPSHHCKTGIPKGGSLSRFSAPCI